MQHFGELLARLLRERMHMNVREFSRASGISTNTLSKWFKLDRVDQINPASYRKLVAALGMTHLEFDALLRSSGEALPAGSPDPEADLVLARVGLDRLLAAIERKRRLSRGSGPKAG